MGGSEKHTDTHGHTRTHTDTHGHTRTHTDTHRHTHKHYLRPLSKPHLNGRLACMSKRRPHSGIGIGNLPRRNRKQKQKKGMQSYNTHVRNSWEHPPSCAYHEANPSGADAARHKPTDPHFLSSRLAGSEVSAPLFGICGQYGVAAHSMSREAAYCLIALISIHFQLYLVFLINRITVSLPTRVPVQACMPRSPCLYTHHTSHLRGCTD
jgi:hypothetical protein